MAHTVSVLRLTPTTITIDVEAIIPILDKVGPRPFVLYSINGGSRKGKSFMLNVFLQYLQRLGSPSENWFQPSSLKSLFVWSGGAERVTEGINMWSEPFVVNVDGREVCILLMDTQGNFDDKTSTHHNAVVFAFSALISSVMIWNEMRDVSDDILQFFQCFLGFAKMASEGLDLDVKVEGELTGQTSFQKLLFLLRDFSFIRDFNFGLHDDYSGAERNFKISRLDPSPQRADELNFMRRQILSSFKDVGIFALPHPGNQLAVYDAITNLEPDFIQFTKTFVELIFSHKNLMTKHVGGVEVTGNDFKFYVRRWAKQFLSSDLPQIKNIMETNIEIQNTIALRNATEFYEGELRKIIYDNPDGVDPVALQLTNEDLVVRTLNVFSKIRKLGDKETESEYMAGLKVAMKEKYEYYEQLNTINNNSGKERKLLIDQKQDLEKVITSNQAKLEQLSKENEVERKKCMDAIEAARKESAEIQRDLIAKSEKRLDEIHKQAAAERQQFMQAIEDAKRRDDELRQEMARQQREAARERLQLIQAMQRDSSSDGCVVM